MENGIPQSRTPVEVEAPSPKEASSGREGLTLPYEESCKKVQELALKQLNRFISYEPKVLKGDDAEAIHDMRVSSRRLQQVLDLRYPQPRPQQLRRLRRQVRRSRQVLGEVRNCDVLLEIVGRSLGRKRSARREAWTAVQQFLMMRRSENFRQAARRLGKINLSAFYVDLKELLHQDDIHQPLAGDRGGLPGETRSDFAQDLTAALESVWTRFESQIEHSHRNPRPEVIHGARIATKRLRYLLEVFHEFGVAGSAEALGALRQLQKDLGDWHDLVVLEEMMIEMLARKEFLRDHLALAMDVERLILRNRENKVGYEERYFRMSRDAEIQDLKEWVSGLLASRSSSSKA